LLGSSLTIAIFGEISSVIEIVFVMFIMQTWNLIYWPHFKGLYNALHCVAFGKNSCFQTFVNKVQECLWI
jgi:hypothetical protein